MLLPLVNVPMLDYTLEFLVSRGVQEIFVFCVAHAAQIKEYLQESKWSKMDVEIRAISSENCYSEGDALRHLDSLNIISSDFILISGDVISNIDITKVLQAHKDRVKQDKKNIMTIVMKSAAPTHRTRTIDDDTVAAINPTNGQLLAYDNDIEEGEVELDLVLWEEHKNVQVRYDWMDTHIDICSPEVLHLFTDNFDYQELRGDFMSGILGSEILGNKIFTHVIAGEYAARVMNLRTYDSVSKDIIRRWTYPMTPDNNLSGMDNTSYRFSRRNIYRESKINTVRSCQIEEDTVIGANTSVGANSIIRQSVIGRNCKIGANVTITESYIWEGCVIEDGVTIDKSIVCNGCIIKCGATVQKGSVLSFGVVIGPDHTVPEYSKICLQPVKDDDDDSDFFESDSDSDSDSGSDEDVSGGEFQRMSKRERMLSMQSTDENDVGEGGKGHLYHQKSDNAKTRGVARKVINTVSPDEAALQVAVHDEDDDLADFSAQQMSSGAINNNTEEELHAKFMSEMQETLTRGQKESMGVDNIVLEMSGLKFSHNATVQDYAASIFFTLFELAGLSITTKRKTSEQKEEKKFVLTKTVLTQVLKLTKKWSPSLVKFSGDLKDQAQIIYGLERACLNEGSAFNFAKLFPHILQYLYDNEVIEEEIIINWETDRKQLLAHYKDNDGDDYDDDEGVNIDTINGIKTLLLAANVFLQWLQQDDDSDEDEDEDDE